MMEAWVVALYIMNALGQNLEPDWQLVARSDAVVEAEISPSFAEEGLPSGWLHLRRVRVIVGDNVGSPLSITLPGLGAEDVARIQRLTSSRVLVFLGAYDKTSKDLQLAGDPASAVRESNRALVREIQQVARANESALLRAKAKSAEYCRSGSYLQRRVLELVARLGGEPDEVEQAIQHLLGMGRPAVPCVVSELEGAREAIPVRSVRVDAGKGALEGRAHYTPEQKVDLLDLVLTNATGVSFGSIVNGATAAQRERAIRGWWVYVGRSMSQDEGSTEDSR